MNAAVVHAFNAPPSYSLFADPVPADSEALVTVTAAALHPIVKALAAGTHYGSNGELPFVPGVDGVGRLTSPLAQLPAGTHVYFGATRPPFGTFAERSLASSRMLIPLPDALDDATAAPTPPPKIQTQLTPPNTSPFPAAILANFPQADLSVLIRTSIGVLLTSHQPKTLPAWTKGLAAMRYMILPRFKNPSTPGAG